ncbi:MAG: aminotransferase class III-fold pyridoxal phosphate-dependent enzyme [Pseudomonadota bacterium]
MRYPNPDSKSAAIFADAQRVLTEGGSRSTIRIAPHSLYVQSANGKYVTDVDGNRLFDFNNNYTSMIHGHAHPQVVAAAIEQVRRGTGFSFGSETEFELARLICDRSDNFDRIRFMNSGTEAIMKAIKAARAYTDRPKIAKCENAYHGSYDFAEVSLGVAATDLADGDPVSQGYSRGTPQGVLDSVVVIPPGDVTAARRILKKNAADLAGVLIDPIGLGQGRFPFPDGYLDMVQAFCRDTGALMIADEVVAYRAGPGGAQTDKGLRPDITALGKIIGGGFPVGAVAGRAEVMSVFEAGDGKARLPHGGTYNANPVSMAAGRAALALMTPEAYDRLNALGEAFRQGCREVLAATDADGDVQGQYSLFALSLSEPVLADTAARGVTYRSRGLHQFMVQHGYWLSPGMAAACSTVMDESDIAPFCETLEAGIRELREQQSTAA